MDLCGDACLRVGGLLRCAAEGLGRPGLSRYTLAHRGEGDAACPRSWQLEGSNDNRQWQVLSHLIHCLRGAPLEGTPLLTPLGGLYQTAASGGALWTLYDFG